MKSIIFMSASALLISVSAIAADNATRSNLNDSGTASDVQYNAKVQSSFGKFMKNSHFNEGEANVYVLTPSIGADIGNWETRLEYPITTFSPEQEKDLKKTTLYGRPGVSGYNKFETESGSTVKAGALVRLPFAELDSEDKDTSEDADFYRAWQLRPEVKAVTPISDTSIRVISETGVSIESIHRERNKYKSGKSTYEYELPPVWLAKLGAETGDRYAFGAAVNSLYGFGKTNVKYKGRFEGNSYHGNDEYPALEYIGLELYNRSQVSKDLEVYVGIKKSLRDQNGDYSPGYVGQLDDYNSVSSLSTNLAIQAQF
ncbi:MAG: hypothetical protein KDD25_06875 [Bdellovibrionales bacterium]|nr:hypothetical protein [Bdellovibrionales bacterium]